MRPRHREDHRALFWAFVLFPAVPLAGIFRPALVPWLILPSLYLAYTAGVLTHNHNHCPVFSRRWANDLYGAWLSAFYGLPIFTWVPTHNQNHHRYRDSAEDVTHTWRDSPENTLAGALAYPLRSSRWQLPLIGDFLRKTRKNPRLVRAMALQALSVVSLQIAGAALALSLHGPSGLLAWALLLALPALSAPYFMMFTNYIQHVHCDPASADDHSRNFVSPWVNWLVFDAGYHTVHHEQPGAHWSRYRALHAARAHRIDPALNCHSIASYCIGTYVLRKKTRDLKAAGV